MVQSLSLRVGRHHLLVLNIPTGDFAVEPCRNDLIGYDNIIRALAGLLSYRYPDALLPLVLANIRGINIGNKSLGPILKQFLDGLLK